VQTLHAIDAAMQIDDPVAARLLMQPIDVLRDQAVQAPGALEACEGVVSSARPHGSQPLPADRRSRPITLSRSDTGGEFLEAHGRLALPGAVPIPVIRNSGLGAAARTGQYHKVPAALKQLG